LPNAAGPAKGRKTAPVPGDFEVAQKGGKRQSPEPGPAIKWSKREPVWGRKNENNTVLSSK